MTDPASPNPPSTPPARIQLPGITSGLFIVSPILLLIGWLSVMGASSRGFFDGAPSQTALGTVMIVVGVMSLLAALVLVGVRAMAQQQLDILLRAERDSQ